MRRLTYALLVLLAACGGESTAPKATVNGTWHYSASNITGAGISCSFSNATLVLTQSGATFTGTYSGLMSQCSDGVNSNSTGPYAGNIVDGTVSGSTVSFDFGDASWHQTGSLSGQSMSGALTVTETTGGQGGTVTITGGWAAAE